MRKDPIVDEVRKIREKHAAKFNYDIKAIMADAQKRQYKSGHKIVSFTKSPASIPHPRAGWKKKFQSLSKQHGNRLLDPETPTRFDVEEWEW